MDAISQIFVTYLVNALWQVSAGDCRNVWALCQTDAPFTCDLSSLFVGRRNVGRCSGSICKSTKSGCSP
jgi:hypothetical protein